MLLNIGLYFGYFERIMRKWESFLKVSNWSSQYESVSNFLGHYKRRLGSVRTKDQICYGLMAFCEYAKKDPDELVELDEIECDIWICVHYCPSCETINDWWDDEKRR